MRRNNKMLVERLISREITKIINEAAYATDTARVAGAKGLEMLNDRNSILYKVLSYVGGLEYCKDVCTKLSNGGYDLSMLDKIADSAITIITEAFAAVISPMKGEQITNFKNADPREVLAVINEEGAGYPKIIRDCAFKIHGLLHNPDSSYVNKGINTVRNAGRAVGNAAEQGWNSAKDFYNRNKPW